tara:strand:+ start:9387 stop:9596 length:210 start_codon:yes stop_codon:yes gene_type:complete
MRYSPKKCKMIRHPNPTSFKQAFTKSPEKQDHFAVSVAGFELFVAMRYKRQNPKTAAHKINIPDPRAVY